MRGATALHSHRLPNTALTFVLPSDRARKKMGQGRLRRVRVELLRTRALGLFRAFASRALVHAEDFSHHLPVLYPESAPGRPMRGPTGSAAGAWQLASLVLLGHARTRHAPTCLGMRGLVAGACEDGKWRRPTRAMQAAFDAGGGGYETAGRAAVSRSSWVNHRTTVGGDGSGTLKAGATSELSGLPCGCSGA
jgi:hypothetical protein